MQTPVSQTPVVAMWGLGADGLDGFRRLLQQTEAARGYPLSALIVLVSMTVAEWSYTGYQAEMYALPLFAKHNVILILFKDAQNVGWVEQRETQRVVGFVGFRLTQPNLLFYASSYGIGIRVVQIVKGGPKVSDGYVVLSDSRDPRKLWLYGWATPPLSPMSEGIPYHREPLYSPLHPLWSPEAVWDLAYRPEHFGPPDPYPDLDAMPGELSGKLIFHVRRTHRHYVSRLPGFDPSFESLQVTSAVHGLGDYVTSGGNVPQYSPDRRSCSERYKGIPLDQSTEHMGRVLEHTSMGHYYAAMGSVPQFSEASRDCSPKFKGTLLDDCAAALTNPTGPFGLTDNLLRLGQVPQYAADGRLCSNQYKAENLGQFIANPDAIEGTYGLGESILSSGCVPQVSQGKGRGKCSDKHKTVTCDQWLGQVRPQKGGNTPPGTHWKAIERGKRAIKYLFHKDGDQIAVPLPRLWWC